MMQKETYRAKQHYQNVTVATNYDGVRFKNWYGSIAHQTESDALAKAVRNYFRVPGSVLDIPCGTGRLLPKLLDAGLKVTGGDISDEMINVGRKRFEGDSRVSFQKVDAEKLPFSDNSFDYLTSYRLMCHLPPETRCRVLTEMIRVTRKILVVNYHVRSFSPLYLFNSLFRKSTCSPFPISLDELCRELELQKGVEIQAITKLSWYERSSLLVILRKRSS